VPNLVASYAAACLAAGSHKDAYNGGAPINIAHELIDCRTVLKYSSWRFCNIAGAMNKLYSELDNSAMYNFWSC
jgi:hypothetical protein